MRIRRVACVSSVLTFCAFSATARAQASASAEPTTESGMKLSAPSAADAPTASTPPASTKDAPHRGSVAFGAGLGGGQIRDKAVGAGGVAIEAHLGYFPLDWLGVVGSGGIFAHTVDDKRTLNLYSGALLAELHPLSRLWLSAGPGYYSLGLTNDEKNVAVKARATAVGGEANVVSTFTVRVPTAAFRRESSFALRSPRSMEKPRSRRWR